MTEIRSTVMRLERQIQLDQAQALTALRQSYETLAEAVLGLARERGYLGSDPLGALGQAFAPAGDQRRLGEAARELWNTFFACFRADEAAFEAKRFAEQSQPIEERLRALPEGAWPDAELTAAIIAALAAFWEERHQTISERLDALIKDLGEHQAKLGGAEMQRAYQEDELGRAGQLLRGALGALGEAADPADSPSRLAGRLVQRYRHDLGDLAARIAAAERSRSALASAALAAARREPPPGGLPPGEAAVVTAISQVADDRATLIDGVRALKAEVARLQAEGRTLMEEVADRDRRLARYEFGERTGEDEDERLALYRKAFAELDAGRDARPLLDRVRQLERVVSVGDGEQQQALKLLDRQGAEVVKCLAELRGILPIGEDPKRLRPRLLLASRYDFKGLAGHAQACRDAARDLLAYAARARWALGVGLLAKEVPKLQRIFKEMVALVSDWREKLGDPPGASISIRIDRGGSVVALPALLATDLDAVTKRKGRLASQAAADIVPVLEECLAVYRKALERAKGELLPPTAEVPKRESEMQKLARLAAELTKLGGVLEAAFSEAVVAEFALEQGDRDLIASDHLLLIALQQLDVACDVLAVLPGAPAAQLPPLPPGRGNVDRLLAAAKARAAWLEDVARYRFELKGAAAG